MRYEYWENSKHSETTYRLLISGEIPFLSFTIVSPIFLANIDVYPVGGWATPLKNMNVNWDDNRNPILMGKEKNVPTKPPTSYHPNFRVNWDDEIPNISGKISQMATKPPTSYPWCF